MSAKRTFLFVMAGVAFAAVACIIAGMCMYFPALGSLPASTDPDYVVLAEERASLMQAGMIAMIVGCSCFILSLVALICAAIAFKFILTQKH